MTEHVAQDIAAMSHAVVSITRAYGNARPWWRGQADASWNLVPSLYRKGFAVKESNINNRFRMLAKARYAHCPSEDDLFAWLFLMQHYRLPTRLLDWSESPLVALYFAIEDEARDEADGALWALLPTRLNLQQLNREGICLPRSRDLRQLCVEAFAAGKNAPDRRIFSVLTEQSDRSSRFMDAPRLSASCPSPTPFW